MEFRVGDARVSLAAMTDAGTEPFHLNCIDAGKESSPEYLEAVMAVARPGTLLVADNVVRSGTIIDRHRDDGMLQGIRAFNETRSGDSRGQSATCGNAREFTMFGNCYVTVGSRGTTTLRER